MSFSVHEATGTNLFFLSFTESIRFCPGNCEPKERVAHCSSVKLRGFSVIYDFFEGLVSMKPNMIKKWSIALLVAAGAAGLTGCEGMRVDEGASSATNSGNVADRNVLQANLSGTVVDDFGKALEGVTVYAYGKNTTTDGGGNWILNNVPVTGINVNSTPQNLEQTTDVTSNGNIYITYSKAGYAEYRSKISNPAVITHYGTAGGNPNSIVVDGLVASDKAQLPQLVNQITGILIDRGSYYEAPIGEYDYGKNLTVRLVPAADVVDGVYGSDVTNCFQGCGFYSVGEMVAITDSNGNFTFKEVPKIPGGYILRVDNPGYRPVPRPNDGTGYSYDYDAGTNATLGAADAPWTVTVQATQNQNYWYGIDFDAKTTGTVTYLEDLYVGDYLVASSNVVEGITVGGKYGTVDESSGEDSDDQHNAALVGAVTDVDTNSVIIDANLVDLGATPLKFVFSGDMIPYAAGELPERAIVVFDNNGNQLTWNSSATSLDGRTLNLQLASTPTAGSNIFVRLHKDVFADMAGKRLTQTVDPNAANYSEAGGGATASDPAEIVTGGDRAFYGEYQVSYTDPLIVPDPVSGFAQSSLSTGIPATASLTAVTADGQTSLSAIQASDWRVEELLDAILVRTDNSDSTFVDSAQGGAANSPTDNRQTFVGDTATVEFTAVNSAIYRLRVRDVDGVLLTTMDDSLTGTAIGGDEEDSANSTVNIASGTATVTGNTFLDFQATVGSGSASSTASITLNKVVSGYTVSLVRLNDFGDEVASSAVTITLVDNFMPHVAIQNSNLNGQDTASVAVTGTTHGTANTAAGAAGAINASNTAEMLFTCGIERSDDNGEAEVGDAAYYFPKLNLTASLYDKSNLRAHSETGGLLSTAIDQGQTTFTTAEDAGVLAASLATNSRETPLLATTAATESADGTTATGRSDNYYNSNDYEQWALLTTTAAGPTCEYYAAEISNVTGLFTGNWYPSSSTGAVSTGAVATADDDSDQTTVPTVLSGYSVTGTYNQTQLDGTTATGNILIGPSNCGTAGTSVYDFDRTIVLNMTESVTAPADLAAFKSQTGVCAQTNILSGSELDNSDTGITAIASATSGWNNDHLLITFGDWRTIDDSPHFTAANQNDVANEIVDGSSLNDLMQIVSLTDANGVAATAGNARGVLFVDATPPLATALSHDGSSVVVKFDQAIDLANNNTFQIEGIDGATYTFVLTSATAGTVIRDTDYIGPYGNAIAGADTTANNSAAISGSRAAGAGDLDDDPIATTIAAAVNSDGNVPASVANSQITITLNETEIDGVNIDLSHFFDKLSHDTAESVSGAPTDSTGAAVTPQFYMDYPNLQDASFNSWGNTEAYDAYDNAGTPRLVGVDGQGPIIQTTVIEQPLNTGYDAAAGADDVDRMFLHADSSNGISVTSIHATAAGDTDSIYTADTTATYDITGGDVSVAHVWGYASTGITANNPTTATQLVVKLNVNDADIDSAIAYVYRPDADAVDGGATTFTNTNTITGTGGLNAVGVASPAANASFSSGAAGTVGEVALRDNDANNGSNDTLVVELPTTLAGVTSGDVLVIQNVLVDDVYYSIHVAAPAAVNETVTATSTTEAGLSLPSVTLYKLVQLSNNDAVGELRTGNEFGFTTGNYRDTGTVTYREEVASATIAWGIGVDDNTAGASTTTDEVVNFTASATVDTTDNAEVDYTLDGVASGSVSESSDQIVGDGATLTVTATDEAGNSSNVVFTFRKGHGVTQFDSGAGSNADGEDVILNIISGSAID